MCEHKINEISTIPWIIICFQVLILYPDHVMFIFIGTLLFIFSFNSAYNLIFTYIFFFTCSLLVQPARQPASPLTYCNDFRLCSTQTQFCSALLKYIPFIVHLGIIRIMKSSFSVFYIPILSSVCAYSFILNF